MNTNPQPKKDHKLLTSLKNLQATGQGNTQAAQVLENYLSGVVSPDDKSDDKTAFADKNTVYDDFISSQIADYKPKKAEEIKVPYTDPITGRERYETMYSASPFEPGQFSGKDSQYPAGQYWGETKRPYIDPITGRERYTMEPGPFDRSTDWMDYGFGSVFGTSSGSTGSSLAVQQSLETMMNDLHAQGYSPDVASAIAMEKMYPGYDKYTSGKINPKTGQPYDIPVNFMGMPEGKTSIADQWKERMATGRVGSEGSGDGWPAWPSGSSSQSGSGYGYGYGGDDDPLARGYQRAKFGPGDLQERVNQNFMKLAGLQKKRGGIVSLLRLR